MHFFLCGKLSLSLSVGTDAMHEQFYNYSENTLARQHWNGDTENCTHREHTLNDIFN